MYKGQLVHARDVTETHEAKRALIRAKAAADAAVRAAVIFSTLELLRFEKKSGKVSFCGVLR